MMCLLGIFINVFSCIVDNTGTFLCYTSVTQCVVSFAASYLQ